MSASREEFECYIRSITGFKSDFQVDSNGAYKSDLMNVMLLTWQEQQKRIDELESRLKAIDALSRMRAAALTAFKRVDMNAEIKRKILILKKYEQSVKGGEV